MHKHAQHAQIKSGEGTSWHPQSAQTRNKVACIARTDNKGTSNKLAYTACTDKSGQGASWHAQHAQTTNGQVISWHTQHAQTTNRQAISWHTQHAQTTPDKGRVGMCKQQGNNLVCTHTQSQITKTHWTEKTHINWKHFSQQSSTVFFRYT